MSYSKKMPYINDTFMYEDRQFFVVYDECGFFTSLCMSMKLPEVEIVDVIGNARILDISAKSYFHALVELQACLNKEEYVIYQSKKDPVRQYALNNKVSIAFPIYLS